MKSIAWILLSVLTAVAAEREAWTTSRVIGSPEPPPPYRAQVAFPMLKFDHPVVLARVPGSNLLVVGEQRGRLFAFENKPDAVAKPFADLAKQIVTVQQHPGAKHVNELYGLAFHPEFPKVRDCFLCYTLRGRPGEKTGIYDHNKNLPDGTRVSRFKVSDEFKLIPESEQILLTWLSGGHNGGDLHFGPDGCLYITAGDATDPNPPDLFRTGQDITDILSSILRIDVNRKDDGKNYAIPKDNPFVGKTQHGKPARGEVWAYGFRNPWRMSFDRATGALYTGDVGWEQYEMIHKVERGGNYGWSLVEGKQHVNTAWPAGPTPVLPPLIELDHSLAASITGGYVYRGEKFKDLKGKYLFADWSTRRMWAATLAGGRCETLDEITAPSVRVVAFGEDNAGELYFLDYDTGLVHELAVNDVAGIKPEAFPRTLSTTGLLASAKDHVPANGVVPYEIVAEQWRDGTTASRFIALPGKSQVIDNDRRRTIPGDVDWHQYKYHFPKNTVLMKTFFLAADPKKPEERKRVETQLLHFDGLDWHGYSYMWRDDQRDADLVGADGEEKQYRVKDERVAGGEREVNWTFHSRSQCMQCHNFWAEHALGFSGPQLCREVTLNGSPKNQLLHFSEIGLMTRAGKDGKPRPPHSAFSTAMHPKLVDPLDTTQTFESRAKAYLHANCAHCHRFGGGGAVEFELNHDRDLNQTKLFEPPTRGHFEIPDAKVIAKGDPNRSVLYYRMAKFGGGRMPHLGSEFVDEDGVVLIHNWITRMTNDQSTSEPGDYAQQLKSMKGAMELARAAACDCCPQDERDRILEAASKLEAGNRRDLFEGYLTKPGTERKLGQNPKPKAILNLQGDAVKGKQHFLSKKLQCLNCHKLGNEGQEIGPELMAMKGPRSKAEILESLLEPSRRIEPAYQPYVLKTQSGAAYTGLLVKKDDAGITLKTAEAKTITVRQDDVESFEPSRTSLMPSGLLADLTPQEAADLLAYLMHLKDAPR